MQAIILLLTYGITFTFLLWILYCLLNTPLWAAYICLKGSKSFFFASMFYPLTVRNRIFIFYSFARLGDDLIDNYKDKQQVLNLKFLQTILDYWYTADKNKNKKKLQSLLSLIPTLPDTFNTKNINQMISGLDEIIANCHIPRWTFELLLYGFKKDTETFTVNNENELLTYCVCVASSIGLICTHLCQNGTMDVTDNILLSNAVSLGIGFQLSNISRDIITDLKELNKIYIPQTWMNETQRKQFEEMRQGNNQLIEENRNTMIREFAVKLIHMAEVYYINAWDGINDLPSNVQMALYAALLIYREIGMNILSKKRYPNRSFIPLKKKIGLLFKSLQKPKWKIKHSDITNKSSEILQSTVQQLSKK
eukprot:39614_1